MAQGSPLRLLLIVTGSTLRAEELDRPLGYYLKQRIEQSLQAAVANGRDGLEDYIVRVIADFRWIHDEPLQSLPTISLGGPGVNALAGRWLEEVPVSLAYGERYFIQMDPEMVALRTVSGAWTTPQPRSQFRYFSIASYHGFWTTVPPATLISPRSMVMVTLELQAMMTTIKHASEIAIDRGLLENRRPLRDGLRSGGSPSTGY